MRKLIASAVIVFLAFAAFYFSSCKGKQSTTTSNNEDSLQQIMARGKYLAVHVAACIHCHSQRDFTKYSGPVMQGTEGGGGQAFTHEMLDAIPGVLYSKNITPDPETGIGNWTDDEILRAITKGISKNGDTLFPIMPYTNYNRMAKQDLLSIIAYIKTLKPIKNKVPDRQLMIPVSMAYPAPALQASVDANICPPESDKVKYGEYLVTAAACSDCHTAFVKGQPDFSRVYAGGNVFHINPFVVTSANITPDSATGIGTWTEDMFVNKFNTYREPKNYMYDPAKQNTVMPVSDFAGMKDDDLKAIYAYLRTVAPINNKVEKYPK